MNKFRKASAEVAYAVQRGDLTHISKQTCLYCGEQAEHYHHDSYDPENWLNVVPLCRKCHLEYHKNNPMNYKDGYSHIRVKLNTHRIFKILSAKLRMTHDDTMNYLMAIYENNPELH